MSWLFEVDLALLTKINQVWVSPLLDQFFIFITNAHKLTWIRWGLLPTLLAWIVWRKGLKSLRAAVLLAVVVGVCDLANHRVIKPYFARPRPFQTEPPQSQLRLGYSPGGYSFPSNHAVNTMAGAVLVAAYSPPTAALVLTYTLLVGYSRPYLGVHYPSDILFGWLLGAAVAWLTLRGTRRWRPDWAPQPKRGPHATT